MLVTSQLLVLSAYEIPLGYIPGNNMGFKGECSKEKRFIPLVALTEIRGTG
jgi:hypothetical protein